MKKEFLSITLLLLVVGFLSGCTEFDAGDPLGIESSTQTCVLGIIIVVILVVVLLVGLAKAGTKKNIVIHSPIQDFKERHREKPEKNRFCPDCGRGIPFDAELCPYCGKKFKSHVKEETKSSIDKNQEKDKEESADENNISNYCSKCGTKIEGTLKFCTNCGNKLN